MKHLDPHRITRTESILAMLLIGLAMWTLLAHVIGAIKGNFIQLSQWSWGIVLCLYPIYRLIYAQRDLDDPILPLTPTPQNADWQPFAIAVALVALYEFSDIYLPNSRLHLFWFLTMLFLGRAWLVTRTHTARMTQPSRLTRAEAILFGLTILSIAFITLIAHRPDQDEQYYSNLAVMSLDYPDRPLLSWNQMIWSETKIAWLVVDRLPTFELLIALIASWFQVEPIAISHLVLAPIFAVMTVLAQSLLLRHLTPKYWLSALLIEIYLLLAVGGETRAGYAVFAFVQLHFGKAVLFSMILPLLTFFALRYMQTGHRRDWLLLLIGQIAALGCSTSALFLAPVATGLGLVANWQLDWSGTKRLLLGVTSSAYLLALGLSIRQVMTNTLISIQWTPLSVTNNFTKVFGTGTHLWLYLLALSGAWTLMTNPGVRRLLLGLSLFFVAIFLNPFLYPIFSTYLTGSQTTWRLNFTIPLPAMASLMLLTLTSHWIKPPLASLGVFLTVISLLMLSLFSPWRTFWSQPLSLAVAALVLLVITQLTPRFRPMIALLTLAMTLASLTHFLAHHQMKRTAIDPPRTQLHVPALKVEQPAFKVAQQVVRLAPPDHSALVPMNISIWVPTQRHNPLLVATTQSYLEQLADKLEPQAIQRRMALIQYVSGTERPFDAVRKLTEAIDFYKIGVVVVPKDNPWLKEIVFVMETLGFTKSEHHDHLFWVNPD